MKLLFLDMDGVLNSNGSSHYYWWKKHDRKTYLQGFEELCPIASSNLNFVLEKVPDLKVVISSAWRAWHLFDEWNTNEHMLSFCPAIEGRVIGCTPDIPPIRMSQDIPRGHEIHKWLETHNQLETPFVIIDDRDDMDKVQHALIQTDETVGFTMRNAVEVFLKLGVSLK